MRVLSWNLMHGRAVPPAGRNLFDEFTAALDSWSWDIALLQEVPPWWPRGLAERLNADQRHVLTSRNALLAARQAIAVRRPDLIKSNGGGCNAILARPPNSIAEHRVKRLRTIPERRWLHAVRLAAPASLWIGNLHAGGSHREARAAACAIRSWAAGQPLVLGGDFNLAAPSLAGLEPAGHMASDHFFIRELASEGPPEVLDHGRLSDHAPLLVGLRPRTA